MRILETKRLILKPIEVEDLAYLLNLRWDADVANHILHVPISMTDQHEWYAGLKKNDIALSIFLKEEDGLKIIGTVGLYDVHYIHRRAVLKARIDPTCQRKGYATEAFNIVLDYGFNTMNINKITSDSFEDNTAILNLITKLGFKKEGLLIDHYFHQGQYRNAEQYGLLRKDFNLKFSM